MHHVTPRNGFGGEQRNGAVGQIESKGGAVNFFGAFTRTFVVFFIAFFDDVANQIQILFFRGAVVGQKGVKHETLSQELDFDDTKNPQTRNLPNKPTFGLGLLTKEPENLHCFLEEVTMSKGKQWWPLQASPQDIRTVLDDFRTRLRNKNWLREKQPVGLYHVYLREGSPVPMMNTVNEFMQIAGNDTSLKNQQRVQVLRLLSVLLQWHVLVRPEGKITDVPFVFALPRLDAFGLGETSMGVVAQLQSQGRNLTLMVCEQPLAEPMQSSQNGNKGPRTKSFTTLQSGDAFQWTNTRAWYDQHHKPFLGKWLYGFYPEKKAWVDARRMEQHEKDGLHWFSSAPTASTTSTTATNTPHASKVRAGMLKLLGGMYRSEDQTWALPGWMDRKTIDSWLQQDAHLYQSVFGSVPKPQWRSTKPNPSDRAADEAYEHVEKMVANDPKPDACDDSHV